MFDNTTFLFFWTLKLIFGYVGAQLLKTPNPRSFLKTSLLEGRYLGCFVFEILKISKLVQN